MIIIVTVFLSAFIGVILDDATAVYSDSPVLRIVNCTYASCIYYMSEYMSVLVACITVCSLRG